MSVLDKEISSSGRDCGDDDGDEEEEEDDDENGRCRCRTKDAKKKQGIIGFSRNLGKAKQVVMFPFTKAKKQLPRRNRTSAVVASASSCSGKRFGVNEGSKGCYLCFLQPLTVDSSVESPSSDPNSPNFSHGKLRSLIEKNDFYSKECNHHFDFEPKSPC